MGMDQYLLIPFLGEWTSIYQLFWCSPGVQGFDTMPYLIFIFSRSFRSLRRSQGAERRGGSRGAGAGWSHAMYSARINHGNGKSARIKHGNGKSTIFFDQFPIFSNKKASIYCRISQNAMFDHQRVRTLFLDSLTWLIRKWWEWSWWGFDQQECLIKPAILI